MNRIIKDSCLLAALLFAVSFTAFAEDPWTWTQRYSGPKKLNAVAVGNGTFVTVGDSGAILTSPDGVEWTERTAGTKSRLRSVIWGDGMFAAVGDSGTIITSANGVEWTVRHSGKGYGIVSIVFGGGKYVAVSAIYYVKSGDSENGIYTLISDDGVDWQEHKLHVDIGLAGHNYNQHNLVYGDGLFMAGYEDQRIFISTDGISWNHQYQDIEYNGEMAFYWFDCSNCDYGPPYPPSCNLAMPSTDMVNSIAYGNGVFLLLAGTTTLGLARYEKGGKWEILDYNCKLFGRPERDFIIGDKIFYDGTRFIMMGKYGIYSTDNGDDFELMSTKSQQSVSIAYNGSVYVTVNGTEIGTLSKTHTNVSTPRQNIQRKTASLVTVRGRTLNVNAGAGSEVRIRVMTLTGRTAASFKSSGGAKLSLKRIPSGVYVIEAKNAIDGRGVTSPVLLR